MERDRAQDNTPVAVESTPVALLPRFEAFLGAWAAAARAGDASGLDQFYAADAVLEDVPLNLTFRGPAEIAGFAGVVFGSFSEATVTWRSAFAADGWATAEGRFAGRYTGQLPNLPPGTGQAVTFRSAHIFELGADGVIRRQSIYLDLYGFLAQLGVVPAP